MSLLEDIEASRYTPIDILTTLLRDAEAGKIFDIIVVSRLRPDEGEEYVAYDLEAERLEAGQEGKQLSSAFPGVRRVLR